MDKKVMEVKSFIKEYKNVLSPKQVSTILRIFSEKNFKDATIVGKENDSLVNKNTRNAKNYNLTQNKNITETQWFNFICYNIKNKINEYCQETKVSVNLHKVIEVSILKYEEGGFYKVHHDNNAVAAPREFSVIIFLNNDYEGGSLFFYEPDGKTKIKEVKPEVGKFVIWPSNYLFPHAAQTVTKGTRFVIVSWVN